MTVDKFLVFLILPSMKRTLSDMIWNNKIHFTEHYGSDDIYTIPRKKYFFRIYNAGRMKLLQETLI